MKYAIAILGAALLLATAPAQADNHAKSAAVIGARSVANPGVVPANQRYAVVNARGSKLKEFLAGERTGLRTADCAQVKCPPTFEKDIVCWKCKERPVKSN